eukprot:scaffold23525_cov162-Isochrysis_galbana.AAC.1
MAAGALPRQPFRGAACECRHAHVGLTTTAAPLYVPTLLYTPTHTLGRGGLCASAMRYTCGVGTMHHSSWSRATSSAPRAAFALSNAESEVRHLHL